MVRKGSSVRVRWRASGEGPANAGLLLLLGSVVRRAPGQYRGSTRGSERVRIGRRLRKLGGGDSATRATWAVERSPRHGSARTATRRRHRPVRRSPSTLTIAEAARRVRCCERTIRRAIDAGDLRAGRIRGRGGSRGGYRIRPARSRRVAVPRCPVSPRRRGSRCGDTRLSDGSVSETFSVRWFDAFGKRMRKACASREEADFERARIALEQSGRVVAAPSVAFAPAAVSEPWA